MAYTFYLEGNRKLSNSINSYLYNRDRMTNDYWNKTLYPLLKDTKNEIITKLKAYDNLTDWQIYNLGRIKTSIQDIINKMENNFKDKLKDVEIKMYNETIKAVDDQAKLAKIEAGMPMIVSQKMLETLVPLSEEFITYFAKDVSKIVMADISLALIRGESIASLAKTITDKFGLTDKQIALYKSDKERIESYFKQGKISKEKYDQRIASLNKQLEKGSMMSYARAERIAKTETLRASSFARQERMNEIAETNPDVVKIWIHTSTSPLSRETHIEAEQRYRKNPIAIDEDFEIDGEFGQYPRDISFSAKNTCNCGCLHLLLNKDMV